jgi:hypothetical protein
VPQHFSHANRERDPALAEQLFWSVLDHLQRCCPQFGQGQQKRYGFRFKRLIHLVDSTTISLVANCMDWAKHRRRKAAAKCHVRLDWGQMLPRFIVVEAADEHDSQRTLELCAGVKSGEIVIFGQGLCRLRAPLYFTGTRHLLGQPGEGEPLLSGARKPSGQGRDFAR